MMSLSSAGALAGRSSLAGRTSRPAKAPRSLAITRASTEKASTDEDAPTFSGNTVFYAGRNFTEQEWAEAQSSGSLSEIKANANKLPYKTNDGASDPLVASGGPGFGELMAFNGPAPETINGRLAMLGFVAAVGAELASGKGVLSQIGQEPTLITLTFVLFAAASLVPLLKNDKEERFGIFTPKAELINGRAAMLGFASLLVVEAVKGSALF